MLTKLLIVVLLVVSSCADITSVQDLTVFGYHQKIGILKAARIKKFEDAAKTNLNSQRIVGGSVTDISSAPYQVGLVIRILNVFTSICGGSLISSNRIITAAHCYHDGSFTAQSFIAVLGSNTLFSGGERTETADIDVHPFWNPITAENDLAIIRISTITFSDVIQPIALPDTTEPPDNFVGQISIASGYGVTSDGGSINMSQVLSSVPLRIISNEECSSVYQHWVHNSNICTSGERGQNTCIGDSGGPLTINNGGSEILVGVTSFGADVGCELGFPAAYTRITSFLSWIYSLE